MHYINEHEVDEQTKQRLEQLLERSQAKYWKKKRAFDLVMSTLILILIAPLCLIVMLVIYLDDPHGSPIFSQVRIGRHGKPFRLYKFRSMKVNAEQIREQLEKHNEMDGPVFKMKNDPRITRVGKFIRATSIDELPQLVNVLKGDMSMVGPRPPLPREVEQYTDYQRLRLIVTPGLPCAWQIADARNDISFQKWVEMDLEYIQHRTMWLDLKLILKTPFVMLKKAGR